MQIIGDGAITGGMAYEAMNHAGFLDKNMIVILNDNQQVSLPTQYNGKNQDPVGALSSTLARLQVRKPLFFLSSHFLVYLSVTYKIQMKLY